MSGPEQRDMEQPWPPPGPWSFPRTDGQAEEESDLDVSPSSSHYPPVPGGGAQVKAACILGGKGRRGTVHGHRAGGADGSPQAVAASSARGGGHALIPDPHVHAHSSLHLG